MLIVLDGLESYTSEVASIVIGCVEKIELLNPY